MNDVTFHYNRVTGLTPIDTTFVKQNINIKHYSMKTRILQILFAVILSVSLISCGNQSNQNSDNDGADTMTMNDNNDGGILNDKDKDMEFVEDAALGGLMEVELGRYVEKNASNQRVKNFASMMVRDHSKANDELKSIAAQKNLVIPTMLDEKHMDKVNKIREKRGAELDKEYMSEMVDDHEKDADKFKRHAENGNDPDLKAFAAKTLPILLMHQDSAKNINDAIK